MALETPIWLIRHGKSALGFDQAEDSDLSELGMAQAAAAARRLAAMIEPCAVLASRFRRAQSTARPLAELWGRPMVIAPEIDEIPAPAWMVGPEIARRRAWLDAILTESYGGLDPAVESWRAALLAFVSGLRTPTALFTHYLTINALVGAATGDARVALIDPDYCEVIALRVKDGRLDLERRP